MSYQEDNEITTYSLKRLGLFPRKYEILILSEPEFNRLNEMISAFENEESKILHETEQKKEHGKKLDLHVTKIIAICWMGWCKEIVMSDLPKDMVRYFRKLRNNDFIILVNRRVIDSLIQEEKLITIAHEVIHYAQREEKIPRGKTLEEIDEMAEMIVKEFMAERGQQSDYQIRIEQ
jgi:hypothetical protein